MSKNNKIGNQYINGIIVADIAIQSTTLPVVDKQTTFTGPRNKSKRRVTFNLDNIQIKSIPSIEDIEDDEPLIIVSSRKSCPERISKKEAYDALQQRKQIRRHNSNNKNKDDSIYKYWYPLRSSVPLPLSSAPKSAIIEPKNNVIFYPSPIYSESHQRQMNSILVSESDSDSDDDTNTFKTPFRSLTPPLISSQNTDTDDSDTSLKTPSPDPYRMQLHDIFTNDELPPLTLPFEEKFLSILSKTNTLLNHKIPDYRKRRLFFIRVTKAEHLDLPIDHHTNVFCNIKYGNHENKSLSQPLTHTMHINQQYRIIDVDPNKPICITLQVDSSALNNWYHKIKPSSELHRYIHERDGNVCQASFLPSRFIDQETTQGQPQSASLMLVNNWYTASPSLFSPFKKSSVSNSREKAVGKLQVECFYIETIGEQMPEDIDQVIDGLNAKRFHQTIWQSGYMTQHDEKVPRYFTLKGGVLFSDDSKLISLSKVNKVTCGDQVMIERYSQRVKQPYTLLRQLEMVMNEQSPSYYNSTKDFQLHFDNGNKIMFHCNSVEERNRWVSVIEIMICKLPKLPTWIKV